MYGNTIWDTEIEEGVKYKDKFKEIMLKPNDRYRS